MAAVVAVSRLDLSPAAASASFFSALAVPAAVTAASRHLRATNGSDAQAKSWRQFGWRDERRRSRLLLTTHPSGYCDDKASHSRCGCFSSRRGARFKLSRQPKTQHCKGNFWDIESDQE